MKENFEIKVTNCDDYDVCNNCFEIGMATGVMSRAFVCDKVIYVEQDGKIVGFLSACENLYNDGDLVLTSMAILKEYQDKGVADMLFDYILHHSQGKSQILSDVHLENERVLDLYKKLGFTEENEYDYKFDGEKIAQIKDNSPLEFTEEVTWHEDEI